jgi:beta-N-acetylhexosaminidase
VLRILRLKERLGLFDDPYTAPDAVARTVGTPEHLAAADLLAERTTTLLVNESREGGEGGTGGSKDDGGVLPLSPRTGTTGPPTGVLTAALAAQGFRTTTLPTGTAPSAETIAQAVAAADGVAAVVVATYNVTADSAQKTLVERLSATGRPVIAVAIRNPHDVAHLPSVTACLATYCWTDVELRTAARVIAGVVRPQGRLPVPVQRADDPTRVLYPIGHGLTY